jgi:hypothetical protein
MLDPPSANRTAPEDCSLSVLTSNKDAFDCKNTIGSMLVQDGPDGKTIWRVERLPVVTLMQHHVEIGNTPEGGHDQAGIAPNFSIPSSS